MGKKGRAKTIQGDVIHGDKISGDKIRIGNIASGASVAVGRGSHSSAVNIQAEKDLAQHFAQIYAQIEARPEDPQVDKDELRDTVKRIEKEAAKGEKAEPVKIKRWFAGLAQIAPDIVVIIAAVLTNPTLGVSTAVQKVAQAAAG